jgi:hypothetical protein
MNILSVHPVTELRRLFRGWLKDINNLRAYREENYVNAAKQIAEEDAARWQQTNVATHKAKVYDEEALTLLDTVLADGRVEPSEIPALKKARAMTQHSARFDAEAGELTKVDAV